MLLSVINHEILFQRLLKLIEYVNVPKLLSKAGNACALEYSFYHCGML